MIAYANVVVYSYQYMLDPKVSQMVRPSTTLPVVMCSQSRVRRVLACSCLYASMLFVRYAAVLPATCHLDVRSSAMFD